MRMEERGRMSEKKGVVISVAVGFRGLLSVEGAIFEGLAVFPWSGSRKGDGGTCTF